jgi:hypothetical protein
MCKKDILHESMCMKKTLEVIHRSNFMEARIQNRRYQSYTRANFIKTLYKKIPSVIY